ncbi:adenosylhomocysteinase [Candidatus Poribacteria bacterium]|nr:adenosylhomocysteinase [Candidatus Poribacteria bacterium]MYA98863.1 adenosylhomocysteinase [Candidatus Poribacteria bacterium]
MNYDIKTTALASAGKQRIDWANRFMPVLDSIRARFQNERPLEGLRVAACLHVTTETANLMKTLKAGGAETVVCASNPLSTQDDVAASLVVDEEIGVFAINGEDTETYYKHIDATLDLQPTITMDDGADLVSRLHSEETNPALVEQVVAGTEETTTGVIRLRSMASEGVLRYPIIAVNDAQTKHFFDNRYGTGQSTLDGIIRATNLLIAGTTVVVAGYGWCGRGVASRARGLGANVIVTEVTALKALEAVMDGFRVMPMQKAVQEADLIVTLTGDIHVLRKEHFEAMKAGAIIANSGHFNVEIDIPALEELSVDTGKARPYVDVYTLEDGKKLYLVGEGRLVNLAAAEGHPASVMDMSFANQALSLEYIAKNHEQFENRVYDVPESIDETVAQLKLKAFGVEIDTLTAEQEKYLNSWEMGT